MKYDDKLSKTLNSSNSLLNAIMSSLQTETWDDHCQKAWRELLEHDTAELEYFYWTEIPEQITDEDLISPEVDCGVTGACYAVRWAGKKTLYYSEDLDFICAV